MRLIPQTLTIAAVVVAALWTQSPPANAGNLPPGRIASLIPSDDEVSQFVGLAVRHVGDPLPVQPRLPDHLADRDECRSLYYLNTTDVWSQDYSAFRGQVWTYQPDPSQAFVTQSVGSFTDSLATRDRFNAVYNASVFNTCNHADLHGPPLESGVTFEVYHFTIDNDVVIWTLAEKHDGQYTGYNTVCVAWRLGNVMSISSVSQQGNPSQAVKRLTDFVLSRVG